MTEQIKKDFGTFAFNYTDAQGDNSDRQLHLKTIDHSNGHLYLKGITNVGPRTFRIDRITNSELTNCNTGEIQTIEEFIQSLAESPEEQTKRPAKKTFAQLISKTSKPQKTQPKTNKNSHWKIGYLIIASSIIWKLLQYMII